MFQRVELNSLAGRASTVDFPDRVAVDQVRRALRDQRLALAFQPVVFASDPGRAAYHEGLIRLMDETGKVIPARQFIDVVEPTEVGRQVDCVALEMGLAALRRDQGLRLAVNMSARSIGHALWAETLMVGLRGDDTIAERLILEITETSVMLMPEIVASFMRVLQRRGVSFAMDDFGTGQTSFRYFRDFFFDIVKIDRQFIRNVHIDRDNAVLVRALAMIARQFEMTIVAEGVEQREEADWLQAEGIDYFQGYLYGVPATLGERSDATRLRRA
jgi:EAL domain-containing protein (putative c-di-GMP-specific phosphodiesterase class I)